MTEAKRPDLNRLQRQVMGLREATAAARYIEQLEAAIEFPPRQPSPQAMEMACQRELRTQRDRAEKAEAAAREMGQALMDVAMLLRAIDIHAPESRAWAALARHPEFAPAERSP